MAEFRLDRIRFNWKGNWAQGTRYIVDDVVLYAGKAFVVLTTHNSAASFYTDFDAGYFELMLDGVEWTGDWLSSTVYSEGQVIRINGRVYSCINQHTSGNTFIVGTNWTLVASTQKFAGNWTANNLYYVDDVVKFNGILYKCIQKHTSTSDTVNALLNDISNWQVLVDSDSWRNVWTVGTTYRLNDLVKYGGIVYRCISEHTSAATIDLGLEDNQSDWEVVSRAYEYKSEWTQSIRYKINDIVKYGPSLWICTTPYTSGQTFDETKFTLWIPGVESEGVWDPNDQYQIGDVVSYGGYQYQSLTINVNQIPSLNSDDWENINQGFRWLGNYNENQAGDSSIEYYRPGDVVRLGGNIYVALQDNIESEPGIDPADWELIGQNDEWTNTWEDGREYYPNDLVTYAGTLYRCITRHVSTESDSRPDIDVYNADQDYWEYVIIGAPSGPQGNVLASKGDLKTHDGTDNLRLPIGDFGQVLTIGDSGLGYSYMDASLKTYYVSTNGTDAEGYGLTTQAPFRTIKYACEYILDDEAARAPATVFVKTGIFKERLPIIVPANVAIVGDELRGTNIQPADSFIDQFGNVIPELNNNKDMFRMRNGSGLRNCTLEGLSGTLGQPGPNFTRRPTAGAYVSLDPGLGPNDSSTWITSKSPYVQNVTTLGTGCVGMKIDGALHNGGNRSIVANDFTQILSDGIGYWATNQGRSELVSVFTYYCHVGYLAENGGILRGTNGNNSYGTYGSVAEGFDANETPITGKVDNRTQQAQTGPVYTDGNEILAVSYTNAGQSYTEAQANFTGPGANFNVSYDEFRKKALTKVRLLEPVDSSVIGGRGHTFFANFAQGGGVDYIILAAPTDVNPVELEGLRIWIISGPGRGQYGYIHTYNNTTKRAIIRRESDDTPGFDNIVIGKRSELELNTATQYNIETRPITDAPTWTVGNGTTLRSNGVRPFVHGFVNDKFLLMAPNNDTVLTTDNPVAGQWQNGDVVFDNINFVKCTSGKMALAVSNDSPIVVHSADGLVWDFSDPRDSDASFEPQLLRNGDFALDTLDDWFDDGIDPFDSIGITNGRLVASSTGNSILRQLIPTVPGNTYGWSIEITASTGGFVRIVDGGNPASVKAQGTQAHAGAGVRTGTFVADSTAVYVSVHCINNSVTVDNLSVSGVRGTDLIYNGDNSLALTNNMWTDFNLSTYSIVNGQLNISSSSNGGIEAYMPTQKGIVYNYSFDLVQYNSPASTPNLLIRNMANSATTYVNRQLDTETPGTTITGTFVAESTGTTFRIENINGGDLLILDNFEVTPVPGQNDVLIEPGKISFDVNPGFNSIALGGPTGETAILVGHTGDTFLRTTIDEQPTSTLGPSSFTEQPVVPLASEVASTGFNWVDIAYGAGAWVAIDENGSVTVSLDDGNTWTTYFDSFGLDGIETLATITFGNNAFVVTINDGDRMFVSADKGVTWDDKEIINDSTRKNWIGSYSQGVFVLSSNTGDLVYSQNCNTWETLPSATGVNAIIGGYDVNNDPMWLATGANPGEDRIITGGAIPLLRTTQASGNINEVYILDPGSGLTSPLEIVFDDPGQTTEVEYETELANNVLGQPSFNDRGIAYVTAQFTVTGDGFAEILPFGNKIFLKDVSRLPGPGDNLRIASIPGVIFSVTKIIDSSGSGPFNLEINLIPNIGRNESPEHDEDISIRQKYSQIRLTGHDFLDIGSGNFEDTNYPDLYVFGQTSANSTQQFNEIDEYDGGRVFYTSTDQDGNFRVGELFSVEQARGTVTLSADFFEIDGLTELRLGAIRIGGTNAVINEFSIDATFADNSDNIIPTQKAIKTYLENRFSGGGANVNTNTLLAGSVEITGSQIGSLANLTVNVNNVVDMNKGVNGTMAAMAMFNAAGIKQDMVNG